MWNGSILLIETVQQGQNGNGFPNNQYKYSSEIPANISDTTRTDEVAGNQLGYNADITVEIAACNYAGESTFKDVGTGIVYDVKRTYRPPKSMNIILTGEARGQKIGR